ncbi:hypothetical protein [Streptomyces sp. NPDC048106]|uniref:hypothetical protein n=1 Tax=Streptomyces sp. NPDC048106 TaxID=3155750 RepID=UPI003454B4F2
MADSTAADPPGQAAGGPGPGGHSAREALLFGGVYGAVLASSMIAALSRYSTTTPASRRYDALWLLVTAFASALAHGYAHYIAERAPHRRWDGVRALRNEWPLVAAVLPTVFLLAGAGWGWWPPKGVEYPAFTLNILILFTLGLTTARQAARPWPAAVLVGLGDALLGLVVVVANALIK